MNLNELKGTLRGLVRKTIETRFSGANYATLAQAPPLQAPFSLVDQ